MLTTECMISNQELTRGLEIDLSVPWREWNWKAAGDPTGYDFARMEEFRNRVVLAYRLYDRISREHLMEWAKAIPINQPVLDAGGGTGRQAIPLAMSGFCNITLLDVAPGWLKLAREKIEKAELTERIRLVEDDVRNMKTAADNSFALVIALGGVISYCGDGAAAINELYRVTQPGGRIILNAHNKLLAEIMRVREGNIDATIDDQERSGEESNYKITEEVFAPAHLLHLIRSAGFVNVQLLSQYNFLPSEDVYADESTEKWEDAVVEAEMDHFRDPRYLANGMLLAMGEKPKQ